jgi:hypothetical protein
MKVLVFREELLQFYNCLIQVICLAVSIDQNGLSFSQVMKHLSDKNEGEF